MDSDTIQTMLDILVSALAPGLMLYLTNLARKRLAQIQKESWYSTVELVAGNVVLAAEQLDKANLLKDRDAKSRVYQSQGSMAAGLSMLK